MNINRQINCDSMKIKCYDYANLMNQIKHYIIINSGMIIFTYIFISIRWNNF